MSILRLMKQYNEVLDKINKAEPHMKVGYDELGSEKAAKYQERFNSYLKELEEITEQILKIQKMTEDEILHGFKI